MNWTLFWTAFGAIGSTIGSIVTATAVIIALKQYKEPMKKRIKIGFNKFNCKDMSGYESTYYNISFMNKGIRECTIDSIYIMGKKGPIEYKIERYPGIRYNELPLFLEKETKFENFIPESKLKERIQELCNERKLNKNGRLCIYALDTTGEMYKCKTDYKIKSFIEE